MASKYRPSNRKKRTIERKRKMDAASKNSKEATTTYIYFILFGTTMIFLAQRYSSNTSTYLDLFQTKETRGKNSTYFCPIQDLKNGSWVNITYDLPPYTPMKREHIQRGCPAFEQNNTFNTWIWEPEAVHSKGCSFKSFEEESYCRLMKNKTVAIMGDSLSFHHFLSLSHLLGVPHADDSRFGNAFRLNQVCNNSSKLIGRRDDHLNFVEEIVHDHFPDVLVLNRGAHYVPDDRLLKELNNNIFPQLNNWQAKCRLENKDCLLIWRTTVPGHPNCMKFTRPSNSVEEMERIIETSKGGRFQREKFSVQNELVLKALQVQKTVANLSYEVMDAYHVNILRPDMHVRQSDCLHNCLSKDTTYSWLLNHMLNVKFT